MEASASTSWKRQPQWKRILAQPFGDFEECGVCEVVEREVMEQTPGATVRSAMWVVTNKGHDKLNVLDREA